MFSSVQDFPGRVGLWKVGVPPSGPMDHLAFRIANRLVNNPSHAAALEFTYVGPTLQFKQDTAIALTGARMVASIDGTPVPYYQTVHVKAGSTLTLQHIEGGGSRSYLAVAGGIEAPVFLGSKATFPLGGIGGPYHPKGRSLEAGDELSVSVPSTPTSLHLKLPRELIPSYPKEWEVKVLPGPQESPDYFTKEYMDAFYSYPWQVTHNANRLGVRLKGPSPTFARADGGQGGSHPSNIHDNAYAIGSVNFTGDQPVVLMVDGPSLGGFVCPATIPECELWKMGQVKPGDTIKFKKITLEESLKLNFDLDHVIEHLQPAKSIPHVKASSQATPSTLGTEAVIKTVESTVASPRVQYRMAGDRHLLIEYGPLMLDMNLRVRIHLLEQWLKSQSVPGITETIPGVRSLLVQYDFRKVGLKQLVEILEIAEQQIPDPLTQQIPCRVFTLPLAFRDKWTKAAIDKHRTTIQPSAPYLPDNVDFIARVNGFRTSDEVRKLIFDTTYMVIGLGDVYLGAPCAVPLDARHRLVVPKYNPARTFTPEGAVGIGGSYMCIYPMESPGGYQLIGRTLPIWNTDGFSPFAKDKPWLFEVFDQVKFYQVSESELESQRASFAKGQLSLNIKEDVFDVKKYNDFVKSTEEGAKQLQARQQKAQQGEADRADSKVQHPNDSRTTAFQSSSRKARKGIAGSVGAPTPGKIVDIRVQPGQHVEKGATLVTLSVMKMEINVPSPIAGTVTRVVVKQEDFVSAGDLLAEIAG